MTEPDPLVGRRAELGRLAEAVQRARCGSGGILLISGDAGIGKSRLVAELAARERDVLLLGGAASHGGNAPYGAVVAALRAHLRVEPDALQGPSPLRPHLARLLPELGEPAESSDRATLIEALRCALEKLAADRAVVLVLEDL